MNSRVWGVQSYSRDERGLSTIWSIFWTAIFLFAAGVVIDTANAFRNGAALQATADSAALSGLMAHREIPHQGSHRDAPHRSVDASRGAEVAQTISVAMMNARQNGAPGSARVELGEWDGASFNSGSTRQNAMRVTAKRTRTSDHPIRTAVLGLLGGMPTLEGGAVSIAEAYKAACPSREGAMAGHSLTLGADSAFNGDLCLHGQVRAAVAGGNAFFGKTTVSYGRRVCGTSAVCGEDAAARDSHDLEGRIGQAAHGTMPDVAQMYLNFKRAIADPTAALSDLVLREYLPPALVRSFDGDGNPVALHIDASTGAVRRNTEFAARPDGGTGRDFAALISAAGTSPARDGAGKPVYARPLVAHTIYEVFDCGQANPLRLTGAVELKDVVIVTDCQVLLGPDVVMSGSVLLTSFGDPDYDNPRAGLTGEGDYSGQIAVTARAGTTIGTGACKDPSGASKIIAAGDIDFSGAPLLRYSQILSKGDIAIAAAANGTEGTSVWARGDVDILPGSAWRGCRSVAGPSDPVIPTSFRLVY